MDLYSQGYERSYTVNSSILNAIEPHLKDFQQLLLDPPKVKSRRRLKESKTHCVLYDQYSRVLPLIVIFKYIVAAD